MERAKEIRNNKVPAAREAFEQAEAAEADASKTFSEANARFQNKKAEKEKLLAEFKRILAIVSAKPPYKCPGCDLAGSVGRSSARVEAPRGRHTEVPGAGEKAEG